MKRDGEIFVGIDAAKARNAIAVAEGGRNGEIRYLGEIDNTPDAVARLIRKLSERHDTSTGCQPRAYRRRSFGLRPTLLRKTAGTMHFWYEGWGLLMAKDRAGFPVG